MVDEAAGYHDEEARTTVGDDGELQQPVRDDLGGFWHRLLKLLRPSPWERLQELNTAIEYAPEAATNLVLRGELYLEMGEYKLALDDFDRALTCTADQIENRDWGVIAQAMQDRAQRGLEEAERRLRQTTR